MTNEKQIFNTLRAQGYRITPQREQILNLLKNRPKGDHLSVDEIENLLKKNNIKISKATLYRNLKFLVINGLVREIDFAEAHKHYEYISDKKQHHHLICNSCGMTIEFEDEKLIKFVNKVAEQQNNFQVNDYQLKIFGLCPKCQGLSKKI